MAPILSIHPGSLNPFALKLKQTDTISSIRARAARKLAIPHGEGQSGADEIQIKYLWCDVFYTLDDDDDFEVFLHRHSSSSEVTLLLSSPSIPTKNPSIASVSSLPPSSSFSSSSVSGPLRGGGGGEGGGARGAGGGGGGDSSSVYSAQSYLYGRGEDPSLRDAKRATSLHLVHSSSSEFNGNGGSVRGAGSVRSGRSGKSGRSKRTITGGKGPGTGTVPEHKIKFEEFHNQLGVRTFIGSIGPVENVRMMMKSGHRACYMSRAFAQEHNFIPRDAAPGFYGFSGITNLGVWPIKVGNKTVEQQVMLVENSYFPVILGRSFMERRGVRTDPLDQTSVLFMDTNEVVPTDLVIVKDANGVVVPIS
ncbi:hypothetical protein JCM11251_001638 [Rhodosporidiobolus azoricus]